MLNVLGDPKGATKKMKDALGQMGISSDELAEVMASDPVRGIRGLLKSIEHLPNADKIGVLKRIFGEEAAPKIAQITSNMQEFDKITGLVCSNTLGLGWTAACIRR